MHSLVLPSSTLRIGYLFFPRNPISGVTIVSFLLGRQVDLDNLAEVCMLLKSSLRHLANCSLTEKSDKELELIGLMKVLFTVSRFCS